MLTPTAVTVVIVIFSTFAWAQPAELYPFLKDSRWGYLDKHGGVRIAPKFESAGAFHEGLAAVKNDGFWGYIDLDAKLVIDYQFPAGPDAFFEGRLRSLGSNVEGGKEKWGYRDKSGAYVIKPQFDRALDYSEGAAAVVKEGKWFFIDVSGKRAFVGDYDDADSFHEGYARIRVGGKFGFVDHQGQYVVEPRYASARAFSGGLAAVAGGDALKWGYADNQGNLSIPLRFDNAGDFSEGVAAVQQGLNWGFIDRLGDFVVPPRYRKAQRFSYGLAAVQSAEKQGTYGYIDHHGVMRIPALFASATGFFGDGVAKVGLLEDLPRGSPTSAHGSPWWGYIDTSGRLLWSYGPTVRRAR
jgi:hypothetical protein